MRHDDAAARRVRRDSLVTLEIIMIRYFAAAAVVLVLTAGCNNGGAPEDPKMLAGVLSGNVKGGGNTNPMCKLFSVDEASAYAGISLNAGVNAVMGDGLPVGTGRCTGMVMISASPIVQADHPSHAPHFRELPELGKGRRSSGWWHPGPNASEKTAIALIMETLKLRQ